MNKIIFLLTGIFLLPGVILAQDLELEKTIYIVQQQNRTALPPEACNWALQYLGGKPLITAFRSDLYTLSTDKNNGSIKKVRKNVGVLVGCTADYTLEYERVVYPTADFGEIWKMTLNGKQYNISGSNRMRTAPDYPPYGFPIPNTGMFVGTSTGTVHKLFETNWPPVVAGAFSCNWLSNPSGADGFDELATCMVSLYE